MLRSPTRYRSTVLFRKGERSLAYRPPRGQRSRSCSGALHHALAGPVFSRWDEDDRRREAGRVGSIPNIQVSSFHTSARTERAAAIALGLATLSAASFAGAQAVQAYNEWKANRPEVPPEDEPKADEKADEKAGGGEKNDNSEGKRENVFTKWFNAGVGSKFYEGGFEETMTRREAALILGVRESSATKRIKEAHRKLLILNHPDTGGSTYMAGKINEAKELLLKGKKQ